MQQSLTKEILDHLVKCGIPLIVSNLFLPYGTTFGQALRETERRIAQCPHDFSWRPRRTVSVTLARLQKQGFVKKSGARSKMAWRITKEGRNHFVSVENGGRFLLPKKDGKLRFVVFDVPEEHRKNRDWLRVRLASCDYSFFQKSVWVGTGPLPQKLFDEFIKRGMTEYVHVVGLEEIVKLGKS